MCGFAWWLWFPSKNHHWNNQTYFLTLRSVLSWRRKKKIRPQKERKSKRKRKKEDTLGGTQRKFWKKSRWRTRLRCYHPWLSNSFRLGATVDVEDSYPAACVRLFFKIKHWGTLTEHRLRWPKAWIIFSKGLSDDGKKKRTAFQPCMWCRSGRCAHAPHLPVRSIGVCSDQPTLAARFEGN